MRRRPWRPRILKSLVVHTRWVGTVGDNFTLAESLVVVVVVVVVFAQLLLGLL